MIPLIFILFIVGGIFYYNWRYKEQWAHDKNLTRWKQYLKEHGVL